MASIPLPFTSYETRAPRGGVQKLVNCFPEKGQQKGEIILYGDPGIRLKETLPKFPQRGAIEFQKQLYVMGGDTLYRVSKYGGYAEIGRIPGVGHCPMAENGAQLVIVAEPDAYVWDGTTLAKITDEDFTTRGAADCTFVDNYILFTEPNSGRFFGSELGEATAYDALDFATAESYPDDLIGIESDHGQIFLAGERSCELWDNVGGSGFPFARNFNGVIEQGCGAGRSLVKADQTIMWFDDIGMFRRLDGVTPVRISNHGVENAISEYTVTADAEGYSFTIDGHIWVVWTFPSEGRTWIYDVTTSQWHEKQSHNLTRWRSKWAIPVYGQVWCGDLSTGKVGQIDPNVYDEYGDTLNMVWTYPPVYAENKTAFHREVEMICETGTGNTSDTDPDIMLEVSDNGGRSFDFLPNKAVGRIGEYRTTVSWTRLGSSPDRVYRGSISAPVRRAIFGTQLRIEQGVF